MTNQSDGGDSESRGPRTPSTNRSATVSNSRLFVPSVYDAPTSTSVSNANLTLNQNVFGSGFTGPVLGSSLQNESGGDLAAAAKPKIGLIGCIIVILACILGSGIFAAPEAIMTLTHSAGTTMIIWVGAGITALIAALCFLELGVTFPVSGGDYAYLNECFGRYPAFLFQISHNFIVCPVCVAIIPQVVGRNLIYPNVNYSKDQDATDAADWAVKLIAIMLIMLLGFQNYKAPHITGKIQGYLMINNSIAILLMIACGFTIIVRHKGELQNNFTVTLPSDEEHTPKRLTFTIVNALIQASFSYFGYTYVNYIYEELKNPIRDLKIGIFIGIPIVMGINLLINFCYLASLSLEEMRATKTVGDDMFRRALGDLHGAEKYISWMATSVIAAAATGGLMSYILTASRISYAAARNGDFPPVFKLVNSKYGTPSFSVIFLCALGSLFTMVPNIQDLILISSYLEMTFNALCVFGMIYMRFKRPDLPRPIKFPIIIPISYALISTIMFFVPIFTLDETNYGTTLFPIVGIGFVVLVGSPLYYLFLVRKISCSCLSCFNELTVKFSQKLWNLIPDQYYAEEVETEVKDEGVKEE